jgi:hypothetical protein
MQKPPCGGFCARSLVRSCRTGQAGRLSASQHAPTRSSMAMRTHALLLWIQSCRATCLKRERDSFSRYAQSYAMRNLNALVSSYESDESSRPDRHEPRVESVQALRTTGSSCRFIHAPPAADAATSATQGSLMADQLSRPAISASFAAAERSSARNPSPHRARCHRRTSDRP